MRKRAIFHTKTYQPPKAVRENIEKENRRLAGQSEIDSRNTTLLVAEAIISTPEIAESLLGPADEGIEIISRRSDIDPKLKEMTKIDFIVICKIGEGKIIMALRAEIVDYPLRKGSPHQIRRSILECREQMFMSDEYNFKAMLMAHEYASQENSGLIGPLLSLRLPKPLIGRLAETLAEGAGSFNDKQIEDLKPLIDFIRIDMRSQLCNLLLRLLENYNDSYFFNSELRQAQARINLLSLTLYGSPQREKIIDLFGFLEKFHEFWEFLKSKEESSGTSIFDTKEKNGLQQLILMTVAIIEQMFA